MPPAQRAGGTLTRSRHFHSVVSREKPSKRAEEAWAESRAEERVLEPILEPILKAVEAAVEATKAGVEEPAVEAAVEATEAGIEEPAVEAGSEPAAEARVHPAGKAPPHVLGVNWAGSPQPYQEGQGRNTEDQESSKHDRPPLVENADGRWNCS
jgi:hypothetical protein